MRPWRVNPERNGTTISISAGANCFRRSASSLILASRLEVAAIWREVAATCASSMAASMFFEDALEVRREFPEDVDADGDRHLLIAHAYAVGKRIVPSRVPIRGQHAGAISTCESGEIEASLTRSVFGQEAPLDGMPNARKNPFAVAGQVARIVAEDG